MIINNLKDNNMTKTKQKKMLNVKECILNYGNAVVKKFSADNYDIPKGDIFEPLVQKLIAKRCEDRNANMFFELEKPDIEGIKYVVFTDKGACLYFTSDNVKGALAMLRSEEIKTFQLNNGWGDEYKLYLASNSKGNYLFEPLWNDDEKIDQRIADMTIERTERITGLAELALTDIEGDDGPSLLDELKSEDETEIRFRPIYADHVSELYLLGAKGFLEDVVEFYGKKGNEVDSDYIEDITICFSALYISNIIRGLEAEKAYQIAADCLSFCLGKKIVLSEIDSDLAPENFNIDYCYDHEKILSWGLDCFSRQCNPKDPEACKKLFVGYNALYQLEGYSESDSRLFAISRLLASKTFPERLILDCYDEVFGENEDDGEIKKVLKLYK